MSFVAKWMGRSRPRDPMRPLYAALVEEARRPEWYRRGGVPDTIDGRFDMVATVLALVLLRLEQAGDATRDAQALVTEVFVEDMDGQLRQQGIGDLVVGKHVGQMMSALGGRLQAYREGLARGGDLAGAVSRNLHRGQATPLGSLDAAVESLRVLMARLEATPIEAILAGRLHG